VTYPLKVLVFGAGAIGTYVGGSLALHGHRAVFIERPEIATDIRQRGLFIKTEDERGIDREAPSLSFTIHPSSFDCVSSIGEALALGPFDVAIFALKSYDTQSAIAELQSSIRNLQSLPPFLCLSNGVDNEPALAAVLGPENVIAGSVTSAIGRHAAGNIVIERKRGIGVAAGNPLSPRLAAAFNQAGLNAHLYPSAADMKWSKMLTNLLANATSAILDMTPTEIFAHPGLCRLEIEQLREAMRVMAAVRIRVVNLPKTPVRALAFAVRYLPVALTRPVLQRAVGRGRGGKMPSFHIDLHAGRGQSEVGYLNGAVVRHGEQLGIPIPVNRLLNETLLALTKGEIPLAAFAHQPEKLLREIGI
jgi:2-dehydropantoate 2-reductase